MEFFLFVSSKFKYSTYFNFLSTIFYTAKKCSYALIHLLHSVFRKIFGILWEVLAWRFNLFWLLTIVTVLSRGSQVRYLLKNSVSMSWAVLLSVTTNIWLCVHSSYSVFNGRAIESYSKAYYGCINICYCMRQEHRYLTWRSHKLIEQKQMPFQNSVSVLSCICISNISLRIMRDHN